MGLYSEMENQIIGDIARRVAKTGRLTETAELQAQALQRQGYSPQQILAEVRKTLNADDKYMNQVALETKAYKEEVADIIKRTVEEAQEAGNRLIGNAGMMSYNKDLKVWSQHGVDLKYSNTLSQLVKAYSDQTMGDLKNLTRSSGALNVNGVPLMNAYRHELDLAVIKVASGGFSFTQAMNDCCHNLAKAGVKIVYPSGRKMNIESAARMCMKTGLSQLSGKITEENIRKTGVDLVYVSAHAGARPSHAEWQGQVYSYSGKSTKYENFYDATGYGTVEGLKGVNCSHEFYPHWEGDAIPAFREPAPKTINGKRYSFYEATQQQRKMERKSRELKREIEAQRAAGNQEKLKELNKQLKQNYADYNDFSNAAGLRAKTERMEIPEPKAKSNKVNAHISARNPNYGKASSIELYGDPLSKKQKKLDEIIKKADKFYEFNKRDVNMKDLSALTSTNGIEYAMFTKGNKRIVIKGTVYGINSFGVEEAEALAREGYKWSGHTHPGHAFTTLGCSDGDIKVLSAFKEHTGQRRSVIYNSAGSWQVFEVN